MWVPSQQLPSEQPGDQSHQPQLNSQQQQHHHQHQHLQWQQPTFNQQQYGAGQPQQQPDDSGQQHVQAEGAFIQKHAAALAMLQQQLLLQEQQQLSEFQQLQNMPATPQTAEMLAHAERLLQNTRCCIQLQERQLEQVMQRQSIVAASAGVSSRAFGDSFSFMQPTINDDPSLTGVYGASSMFGSAAAPAAPSAQEVALIGYLEYWFDKLTRELRAAAAGAPDPYECRQTATTRSADTTNQQQQHRPSASQQQQQQAASSKGKAAKDCKVPSDFLSLADFVQYYTVDKIPYQPTGSDEVALMSRKEITDANGQWSAVKQRASDINIMYNYIEDEACRLTREQGKHYSIEDAVKELTRVLNIGQKRPVGITMSQFRDIACQWNKNRRDAQKAAVAAAARRAVAS